MDILSTVLTVFETKGLLSLAFFAWAWVVVHFGRQILKRLDIITNHFGIVNSRILKMEGFLESHHDFIPYRNGDKTFRLGKND